MGRFWIPGLRETGKEIRTKWTLALTEVFRRAREYEVERKEKV